MPRGPRIDTLQLFHHVWHRGVGKRAIFLDDEDRENLVARLQRLAEECGIRCYAWVLMGNHFHLVLQTTHTRLREFMARLLTGHARYFNERHGNVGHVFQNRYGSRAVVDDADLAGVVVYALQNPREAGLVTSAGADVEYAWSNLAALAGLRRPHAFECVGATLALFGSDISSARKELIARIERGDVEAMLREDTVPPRVGSLPGDRVARFAALVERACAEFHVAPCDLRATARKRLIVDARALAARRAVRIGFTRREIALELGVSESAVCRLLRRPPPLRA